MEAPDLYPLLTIPRTIPEASTYTAASVLTALGVLVSCEEVASPWSQGCARRMGTRPVPSARGIPFERPAQVLLSNLRVFQSVCHLSQWPAVFLGSC